jgi:hypothetical protein
VGLRVYIGGIPEGLSHTSKLEVTRSGASFPASVVFHGSNMQRSAKSLCEVVADIFRLGRFKHTLEEWTTRFTGFPIPLRSEFSRQRRVDILLSIFV